MFANSAIVVFGALWVKFVSLLSFQFHGQSATYSDVLDGMNIFFTCIFTVEFVLKLLAFRFKVRVVKILF